ncbi:MAG: hypothetical protein ACUVXA_19040 [Candidatus Jordarchaeum sp.]|uniref:hypothetical protein n=1 Tax=Candidatus Jordarchaeum sp. TaxID=2823881 RepID=UPI0040491B19
MGWGWIGRHGGWAGPWPGRGPFSHLPPWQRPGWLFGFGRGFGRGWWWGANPYVCARFPWLPRWWWAYPQYGYGFPYASYDVGYRYGLPYMIYGWGYGYPQSMYGMTGYAYPPAMYSYAYPPAPYMRYW